VDVILVVLAVKHAIRTEKLCRQIPDRPFQVVGCGFDRAPHCVALKSLSSNQRSAMAEPPTSACMWVATAVETLPSTGSTSIASADTSSESSIVGRRRCRRRGRRPWTRASRRACRRHALTPRGADETSSHCPLRQVHKFIQSPSLQRPPPPAASTDRNDLARLRKPVPWDRRRRALIHAVRATVGGSGATHNTLNVRQIGGPKTVRLAQAFPWPVRQGALKV